MGDSEDDDKHLELITDVFGQFMTTELDEGEEEEEDDDEYSMYLEPQYFADALTALDITPSEEELNQMLRTLDPNDTGKIYFEPFAKVVSLKLESQFTVSNHNDQVIEALRLFTNGEDREITFHDLRRISAEIKDNSSDEDLREMMLGNQSIGLKDLEKILKQAKAI